MSSRLGSTDLGLTNVVTCFLRRLSSFAPCDSFNDRRDVSLWIDDIRRESAVILVDGSLFGYSFLIRSRLYRGDIHLDGTVRVGSDDYSSEKLVIRPNKLALGLNEVLRDLYALLCCHLPYDDFMCTHLSDMEFSKVKLSDSMVPSSKFS